VSQDIGNVGSPGSATFDPGTSSYAINASGSDIWDVSDSFRYSLQAALGDGEIVARWISINNPDYWTKAGIMIRADTSAGAANAFMLETGPGHDEPVLPVAPEWRGRHERLRQPPGRRRWNGPRSG